MPEWRKKSSIFPVPKKYVFYGFLFLPNPGKFIEFRVVSLHIICIHIIHYNNSMSSQERNINF
jgi:hypothetical protein